jgi:hypothetical protein
VVAGIVSALIFVNAANTILTGAAHPRPPAPPIRSTAPETIMTSTEIEILRSVIDQWKSAVDAHDPHRVASYFTDDAIFQGLHPYSSRSGRSGDSRTARLAA